MIACWCGYPGAGGGFWVLPVFSTGEATADSNGGCDPRGIFVREQFTERLARFHGDWEEERVRSLRVGWIRVGTFLVAFALYVVADVTSGALSTAAWSGMALASLVFILEIIWHRKIRDREKRLAALVRINQEALARLGRDWDALPSSPLEPPPAGHAYAQDLDVSGPGSLFALLSTANLPPGQTVLREWLLGPASPAEIRRRQGAVAELASRLDLRQEIQVRGILVEPPHRDVVERFLVWAEDDPWLDAHGWIYLGAWLLPLLNLLLAGADMGGLVERPWWLISLAATFLLAGLHRRRIHPLMEAASGGHHGLERYADLLEILQGMAVEAPALRELREAASSGHEGGPGELRRLGRKIGWANVRENLMVHVPFQSLFAWDIHALAGLERWKARSGPHVRGWLEALGRLEALSALAALKGEHPDWSFPEMDEEGRPGLRAVDLGHPLLPPEKCVKNDVTVGPPGTFLFLTGSNMSGKSTLLRAIGLNAVLAQAGGPVCARGMSLSPLAVQTSMRTADSLAQGVSQYMAELKRIHQVVTAARGRQEGRSGEFATGSLPVLYLLDEPLQGTNEAERRVAVQTILGHLLKAGAVGAVATHDLHLDEAEGLKASAHAVHLEGQVEEGEEGPLLRFDYRLREGRATSTNALALLRAVGLGTREDPSD